jgi:hypothetical protein
MRVKIEDQYTLAARERAARQHKREAEAMANGESFTPEPEQIPESETSPSEQETVDGYSKGLISDLTATRAAALAHSVSRRPDVGLALAVHALALWVLYQGALNGHWNGHGGDQTCVRITTSKQTRPVTSPDRDNEAVFTAVQDAREWLQGLLPQDRDDLFAWYLEADAIAEAVNLDMGSWWRPSEGFFKRVRKKMIAGAVTEAGCPSEVFKAVLVCQKDRHHRVCIKPRRASDQEGIERNRLEQFFRDFADLRMSALRLPVELVNARFGSTVSIRCTAPSDIGAAGKPTLAGNRDTVNAPLRYDGRYNPTD